MRLLCESAPVLLMLVEKLGAKRTLPAERAGTDSGKAIGGEQSGHFQDALVILALCEPGSGRLIEEKGYVGMKLQRRGGNSGSDWAFDGLDDGGSFGGTASEQKNFARFQNRADSHGNGALRSFFLGTKGFRIVIESLAAQDFHARARSQAGSWLVETNVAIAADAK